MFGMASKIFSNPARLMLGILAVVFFCVICIFLYWWGLAPIVSRFFITEDCIYQGVSIYEEETYLEFDNGSDFKNTLDTISCLKEGKPVDFYYVDNYIEDNPIYGKMCDIYALDVILPQDVYKREQHSIKGIAANYEPRGDYMLYALPHKNGQPYIVVVAFCDKMWTMRVVLITELDTTEGFAQVFSLHSNLNWSSTEGQGDSTVCSTGK